MIATKTSPAWLVLTLTTAVYIISYVDRQLLSLLMPIISTEFGLTDTQIGQLTGIAFPLVYGTVGILVAIAADRVNRVRLIAISVTIFSVMTMCCGLAKGFGSLFLARLGVGIGEAGPNPPSLSLIADNFKGPARQFANSVFTTASAVGLWCAYLVFGNIGAWFGWRTAFVSAGLASLIVGLLVFLCLRESRPSAARALSLRDFKGFPALFRIESYCWAAGAAILHGISTQANAQWLPLFLSRSLDMSQSEISLFLGLTYSVLGLLGIGVGAIIAARLRKQSAGRPQLLGAVLLLVISIVFVGTYLSRDALVTQLGLAFVIFLSLANYGSLLAFVQDITPSDGQGKASAMFFFLMQSGIGAGALVIGLVSDALMPRFGEESLRYALLPIVSLAGLLASICYLMASRSGDRDATLAAQRSLLD